MAELGEGGELFSDVGRQEGAVIARTPAKITNVINPSFGLGDTNHLNPRAVLSKAQEGVPFERL
jgi:hypothetical protein